MGGLLLANKSYRGIRKYTDDYGYDVFDVVLLLWDNNLEVYNTETYFNRPSSDISKVFPETNGLWSVSLASAKRRAIQDTGLKSKDFTWTEIEPLN